MAYSRTPVPHEYFGKIVGASLLGFSFSTYGIFEAWFMMYPAKILALVSDSFVYFQMLKVLIDLFLNA